MGWRFVAKIDNYGQLKMETTLVRYIYITPCPAHPVARKARKPSLQTMCPQRTSDAELTISLLLTSLSVNLIDLTMKPSGRVCGNRLLKQI